MTPVHRALADTEKEGTDRCFICAEPMGGVTVRSLAVLGGSLTVQACGPCVDLPDTQEFVARLITERLMPGPRS